MDSKQLAVLINELKHGGPSPFAPDIEPPLIMLFKNEMETMAGKAYTDVFGEEAMAYIFVTSFRLAFFQRRKRKTDLCKSFWHKVDFGSWRWEEPDGFVAASYELGKPEYLTDDLHEEYGVPALWRVYLVDEAGERKQIDAVTAYLTEYHFHQEQRFVRWNKEIVIPKKDGEDFKKSATFMFSAKINLGFTETGTTNLDALQMLMEDPFEAGQMQGGDIPEDSPMHPSRATRKTESVGISRLESGRAGRKPRSDKARSAAKKAVQTGAQVKSGIELAKKAAGIVSSGSAAAVKASAPKAKRSSTAAKSAGPKSSSPSSKPKPTSKEPASATKKGAAVSAVGPRICVACGARLKATSLFCGKCGEKIAEKIVDEVKDKVSGKLEDLAVEKIEKALDEEPSEPPMQKPKSAAPKRAGARKAASSKTTEKTPALKDEKRAGSRTPKSMPIAPKKRGTKCPSCGRKIQPSWTYCPDCSTALPTDCPQCGMAVMRDWKFCPHCTTELIQS